jgi:hypothetical protein
MLTNIEVSRCGHGSGGFLSQLWKTWELAAVFGCELTGQLCRSLKNQVCMSASPHRCTAVAICHSFEDPGLHECKSIQVHSSRHLKHAWVSADKGSLSTGPALSVLCAGT